MQRSEEAAAQFKKWLKALSDHSRNLLGAKAALVAAETTVKVSLLLWQEISCTGPGVIVLSAKRCFCV